MHVPLVYQIHQVVCANLFHLVSVPFGSLVFDRRTDCMLVIPRTKHIASRMFDFPEPFRPVMALNDSSKPDHRISFVCTSRKAFVT